MVLPVLATAGLAQVAPWRDRCGEDWFGVFVDGQKVGHSVTLTTVEAGARGPILRRRSRLQMTVAGATGPVRVRSATVEDFDLQPPFLLLRRREQRLGEHGAGPSGSEVVAVADGLAVCDLDGRRRGTIRHAEGPVGYGLADAFAEARWVESGPAIGDACTVRSMDTDRMVLVDQRTVLVQRVPATLGAWVEIERRGADGGVEREWLDDRGRTLRWSLGGLEFVRSSRAQARAPSAAAAPAATTVALDGALGDPETLTRWSAVLVGPGARHLADAGGQRLELLGDDVVRVRVARGPHAIAEVDVRELALESTRTFPAADHEALAREAAGQGAPRERVARLCAYVAEFVRDDPDDADHGDLAVLLDRRCGDCSDHVQLFVTLARAVEIPARAVTGWLADAGQLFPHDWAEVALDGRWVPVDPTWNRCPADPNRIRLADDQRLGVLSAGFSAKVERVVHGGRASPSGS